MIDGVNKIRKRNTKFNEIFSKINVVSIPIVLVITFLIIGNQDRENYGTTLLPFHDTDSPSPTFLGMRFANYNLAFITRYPILSELQVFFPPYPLDAKVLGILFLGWILILATLITISVNKVLVIQNKSSTKWKLPIHLLVVFNPSCLDSLFYNDWPGTFFSSQISLIIFLNLFVLLRKGNPQQIFVLIVIGCCLVFLSDPGYLPITISGILGLLVCVIHKLSRFQKVKFHMFWIWLVALVVLNALFYLREIWIQYFEFSVKSREYETSVRFQERFFELLTSGPSSYLPRTSTIYFQVFIALVLSMWFSIRRLRYISSIHDKRALLAICISLALSITPEVTFKNIFFAPTANFFFRDVAFIFILLFITRSGIKRTITVWSSIDKTLIVYLLGSISLALFVKYDSNLLFHDRSWVHRALFSDSSSLTKKLKSNDGSSVGIAISEDAYAAIRNGEIEDLWMPTDLITQEIRLVSAVTKIQNKDFFNIAKSPFHASTVKNLDWCNPQNSTKYWIDYVLLTKLEVSELNCSYKLFGAGKLFVLQVNETPGSYGVFPIGDRRKCTMRVFSKTHYLRIVVQACIEPEASTGSVTLPLQYSSNLKVVEKGERINVYDNKGFVQLNKLDFSSEKILIIALEPSLFIKTKVMSIWILHLSIVLYALCKALQKRRESYALK